MASLIEPTAKRPESEESPLDREALRDQVDRVTEEKRRARLDPGPSWKDWWYFHASKWYVVLGLAIVDFWVVGTWLQLGLWVGAALSAVAVLYADILLYQYLYAVPNPEAVRRRGRFRRSWIRPVEFGRWTPDGQTIRAGGTVARPPEGPTADEFL
jgi:hypothetical protein